MRRTPQRPANAAKPASSATARSASTKAAASPASISNRKFGWLPKGPRSSDTSGSGRLGAYVTLRDLGIDHRPLKGGHGRHGVSPKHLQRTLDEFVFRFDRHWRETELFIRALSLPPTHDGASRIGRVRPTRTRIERSYGLRDALWYG